MEREAEDETAVTVDSSSKEVNEGSPHSHRHWTIGGVFRSIFHASPDSKLSRKMYGNKKHLMEAQMEQDRNCCMRWMIHPCSQFKWYWDLVIMMLLMFTVTVLPISIAFYSDQQLQPAWLTVNTLVDTLFITDVIINFRTGIYTPDSTKEIILDPKIVALKYLRSWFVIDISSSFPFDYGIILITQGKVSSSLLKASRVLRIIRLAKLLSLLKLLRISRLLRFMSRWEDLFDLAAGMMRILKLIMLMLLMAHWNGCIQFLVPVIQDFPSDSWISINQLQNATVGEQYSWALFKAISHMLCIGFGRWPPQNVMEVWLTIISMMVGATFYALFIGNMSTLLLSIDSSGRIYNEKLNQVEEYMRYRKLPQDMRQKITEYYEHRYHRKYFNEEGILNDLSQGLREGIVRHNCQELIQSVPFFQNASQEFVAAVLTKLKFEVFLKGEYIVRQGTKGDKMYFIRSGVLEVITEDGTVVTSLSEGSHFGEICLLTDDRRVASVKASTICDLFSLSKQNFQQLVDEYPEMQPILEAIALQRLKKIGKEPEAAKRNEAGQIKTTISPPRIGAEPCDQYYCDRTEGSKSSDSPTKSLAGELEAAGQSQEPLQPAQNSLRYRTLPYRPSGSEEEPEEEEYVGGNPYFVSYTDMPSETQL